MRTVFTCACLLRSSSIAPQDNLWEFRVTVLDDFTKASAAMVQGVKIRQLFGSCP